MNGGGLGFKTGRSASGSPLILRMIRKRSGSSTAMGLIFLVTGLYFFFATTPFRDGIISAKVDCGGSEVVLAVAKRGVVELDSFVEDTDTFG